MIKRLTVESQIVLDPFMGTGITGLAALKLKRKFVGIEIDPDVFAMVKSRIREITAELSVIGQKN